MTPRIVLGPCPCIDCGRLLVWDGEFWLFHGTNILHVRATCPASWENRRRAKRR